MSDAIPAYHETAFGLEPFEPYDHQADAEELEAERLERDDRGTIVQWFSCPSCDGHGAKVERLNGVLDAILCDQCGGECRLGATEEDLENASQIGSNNPFCRHDWSYTGTAYGGEDESYHGEGRCYCSICGADGDA